MDSAVNDNVIQELFAVPFANRCLGEQLAIKNKGRPTPRVKIEDNRTEQDREKRRSFNDKMYTICEWLTACKVTNRLYCWPCILFPATGDTNLLWQRKGHVDIKNLKRAIARHTGSKEHTSAAVRLKLLGSRIGNGARILMLEERHNRQIAPVIKDSAVDARILGNLCTRQGIPMDTAEDDNIIQELFASPFANRNFEEKLAIKNRGMPRPYVSITQKDRDRTRYFHVNAYTDCEWLTACKATNRLYCWPCILFPAPGASNLLWQSIGYTDVKNLPRAKMRHAATKEHISATVRLTLLEPQRISAEARLLKEQRNRQVTHNRDILKKIIDITSLLSRQELYLPEHDRSTESRSEGNRREVFTLLTKYDEIIKNPLSNVFCQLSNTIQNNLEEVIANEIRLKISKEIDEASFFSWQIDESTNIAGKSQLSTIVRYVLDGRVVERFMGFFDASAGSGRHLQALLGLEMSSFNVADKLVAQSYDGASLKASELKGLQDRVKQDAPQALFIHSYAHGINMVISEGVKDIRQARTFFSKLAGFAVFFSKSTKRSEILDSVQAKRLPTKALTRWDLGSPPVNIVSEIRGTLIETFETIRDSIDFDEESVRESEFFLYTLLDVNFMFLLYTFQSIFALTDDVCKILNCNAVAFCKKRIAFVIASLKTQKSDNGFEKVFSELTNIVPAPEPSRACGSAVQCNDRDYSKELYFQTYDNIIEQMEIRFSDMGKLLFLPLLNVPRFRYYRSRFPDVALMKLFSTYGRFFDKSALRSELSVLYWNDQIWRACASHSSLLEVFSKLDLGFTFPQITKLLELTLTIPNTAANTVHGVSCLKRIEDYARSTKNEKGQPSLALINIERELLEEMERMPSWHSNVTDSFAKMKNCESDFIYNNPPESNEH